MADRTNNILEFWFGSLKHGERRRSGRKVLTQNFERLIPSAALAVNLGRPDYVEILCGLLAILPTARPFPSSTRQIARNPPVTKKTGTSPETASLSMRDRHLIRMPALERIIEAIAPS